MVCYEIEYNKNKIFTETYPYKILLKGYIENNKYKDNELVEKEFILFLETHSEKYQLSIRHFIKSIIVLDVEIYLEKVEEYKIEIVDSNLITQFFYIPENNLPLKYIQVLNTEQFFREKIFKETSEDDLKAFCIASPDYLISLEDIKQSRHGFVRKKVEKNISKKDFAEKMLSEENYKEFLKNMYRFSF